MADRLTDKDTRRQDVGEHLGYVRTRLPLMQSPTFRRAGWPIGSSMVERANTRVVEARLKGSGIRWERTHVKPMLTFRNGVCNERWQETWNIACQQRRDARSPCRHDRAQQRQQARQEVLKPLPISLHPLHFRLCLFCP
jgi:hypothetical protein